MSKEQVFMDEAYRDMVFKHALEQYGTEPDYPWAGEPDYAVLRHSTNKKWYALIMRIPKNRLGVKETENVWVVNVKCDPLLIGPLQTKDGYFPAYHMSKSSWITVLLDGTVPTEEIFGLIDMSFDMTKPKMPKKPKGSN